MADKGQISIRLALSPTMCVHSDTEISYVTVHLREHSPRPVCLNIGIPGSNACILADLTEQAADLLMRSLDMHLTELARKRNGLKTETPPQS